MKKVLFSLLFLCTAIMFAQKENAKTPQIGIKIPLGETVMIDDVQIQFKEVKEDSRCPSDVTCIWAGQAKIEVLVSEDGITVNPLEIVFGAKSNKRLATIGDYYIDALALSPYPTSTTKDTMEYVLIIKKGKKEED